MLKTFTDFIAAPASGDVSDQEDKQCSICQAVHQLLKIL